MGICKKGRFLPQEAWYVVEVVVVVEGVDSGFAKCFLSGEKVKFVDNVC